MVETGRVAAAGRVDADERVVGFVHAKDLLTVPADARHRPAAPRADPAGAVLERTTPLDTVLVAMRRTRTHVAVVVDEERRFVGLATLEDVLESVVGDIRDEIGSQPRRPAGRAVQETAAERQSPSRHGIATLPRLRYSPSPVRVLRVFLAASRRGRLLVVAAPHARGDAAGDIAAARERANRAAAALSEAETRVGELESQVAGRAGPPDQAEAGPGRAARNEAGDRRRHLHRRGLGARGRARAPGPTSTEGVQAAALARLVTQGNADAIDQYRVDQPRTPPPPAPRSRRRSASSATPSRSSRSDGAAD